MRRSVPLLACALLSLCAPLGAAILTVTSTANSGPGTLRQAFADATANGPSGDTIVFDASLAGQTIALLQEIALSSGTVTLNGGTISAGVTITGSDAVTIFRVQSGAVLNLFQVTLSHGMDVSGSGALVNEGTTTLNRCTVSEHVGGGFGGAIYSNGTLELTNCTLSGNSGSGQGGAIFTAGTTALVHCTVAGNSASAGGGIRISAGTTTIRQCIVAGNTATTGPDIAHGALSALVRAGQNIVQAASVGSGTESGPAALAVDPLLAPLGDYGGLSPSRPPLPGSPAIDPAGGATSSTLFVDQRDYPRVADAEAQNGAVVDIGAVEVHAVVTGAFNSGQGSLRNLLRAAAPGQTLIFAQSLNGGVISLSSEIEISRGVTLDAEGLADGLTVSSTVLNRHFSVASGVTSEIRRIRFTGGDGQGAYESGSGGSIANQGTLTLVACEFTGNSAPSAVTGRGGAIFNAFGVLTLRDCTFSQNHAGLGGGALYSRTNLLGITTRIQQCTFSGNTSGGVGGAIYNFDGRLELRDGTVTDNLALSSGGGIAGFGDANTQTSCQNSILSGNDGGDLGFVNGLVNSFISAGSNFAGSGNAAGVFIEPGDVTGAGEPDLAPLGAYGGPVRTRPPLPGSPVIDAGTNPQFSLDQRGAARVIDGDAVAGAVADIGAAEADSLADNVPGTVEFAAALSLLPEGAGPQQVQVVRTGGTRGAVTVTLNSTPGTAGAGDFAPVTNQVVTLKHGETLANISLVPVADPALRESHESFTLAMTDPTGGAVIGPQANTTIWILDASDAVNPSAAFTAPSNLALIPEVSGPLTTVTGVARDDKGVAYVQISVNGAPATGIPFTWSPDLRTATWTHQITLVPGINTITARALDLNGRLSAPATRRISYRVVRDLAMAVNGPANSGSLELTDLGTTSRFVGIRYTVRALPSPGFIFDGWTANDFAGTGVTDAAKEVASLSFAMRENLVLTANFRPDPFLPGITGSYNGLVTVDNLSDLPAGNVTTGFFRAEVNGRGSFSGRLKIDGSDLPVTGVFHHDGTARFGRDRSHTLALRRPGRPDLNVALSLDMTGVTRKLSGQVTQTVPLQGQAISAIDADRAPHGPTNLVSSVYAGIRSQRYTVTTSAESILNDGQGRLRSTYPQGSAVIFLTVFPNGTVSWSGRLADGSRVTGSSLLSQAIRFPWFNSLYGAKGCVAALATLDTGPPDSDLLGSGHLWFRPEIPASQWYPAGWPQGIIYSLVGARYFGAPLPQPPPPGSYHLAFEGGRLLAPFSKTVNLTGTDEVTKETPLDASFSLRFSRANGFADGTFVHDLDGRTTSFRAITLQKGGNAGTFGYFLSVPPPIRDGLGEAGLVTLLP